MARAAVGIETAARRISTARGLSFGSERHRRLCQLGRGHGGRQHPVRQQRQQRRYRPDCLHGQSDDVRTAPIITSSTPPATAPSSSRAPRCAGRHGHGHHQVHVGLPQPHDRLGALRRLCGLHVERTRHGDHVYIDAFDRQVDEDDAAGKLDQRTIWDGTGSLETLNGSDGVTQRFERPGRRSGAGG